MSRVFDRDGSDAMRWFLMHHRSCGGTSSSPSRDPRGVRQVLLPLWNTYTFLALYCVEEGHLAHRFVACAGPIHPAKLAELRDDLTASLDVCDIYGACDQLRSSPRP